MGTGFECEIIESQEGIIPRAVRHLFASINSLKENPYDENGVCMEMLQFSVGAQFMELYNEEIIDLLDPYNKVRFRSFIADGTVYALMWLSFYLWLGVNLMHSVSGKFALFRISYAHESNSVPEIDFKHNFSFSLSFLARQKRIK